MRKQCDCLETETTPYAKDHMWQERKSLKRVESYDRSVCVRVCICHDSTEHEERKKNEREENKRWPNSSVEIIYQTDIQKKKKERFRQQAQLFC